MSLNNNKTPYSLKDINLKNIRYTKIKHTDTKTIVYIKYEDKGKLNNFVLQPPKIYYDGNVFEKNGVLNFDALLKGPKQYNVDLFTGFLNNLDNKVIADSKVNSDWFDNITNTDTLKYQKIIRSNENGVMNVFRNKIIRRDDFVTILQSGESGKLIKPGEIPSKEMWIKELIEIYAVWVNQDGFGLFIRPVLISFYPIINPIYNYRFRDDNSDDEDDDVINTEIESIFVKSENTNNDEITNTTTVMELPNGYNNNLSSTSSEE